jgi:hypothetical protein
VEELRIKIPCEKCDYPETDVIEAHVQFGPDSEGNRVHQSTIYTLQCRSPLCRHVFKKKVLADESIN